MAQKPPLKQKPSNKPFSSLITSLLGKSHHPETKQFTRHLLSQKQKSDHIKSIKRIKLKLAPQDVKASKEFFENTRINPCLLSNKTPQLLS